MLSILALVFLASPPAQEAIPEALAIYPYGTEVQLRDRLIRQEDMFEDLGGFILGRHNESLAQKFNQKIIVLPPLPEGSTLAVVADHHAGQINPAAESGKSVWVSPNGQTSLRFLNAQEKGEASSAGFTCHGAYHEVNLLRPIQPQSDRFYGTQSITVDPDIAAAVSQVSAARLEADVQHLVNFGTRRHGQPGEVSAQNWLKSEFENMGYSVTLYDYDSGADVVIAEKLGTVDPDKIVILGAHYDSINYAGTTAAAPGADDDGSGTAGILEVARILAASDFQYTIRYCGFSGEELGLLGSEAYASHLDNINAEVVGMIQLDMTAYRAAGDTRSVDFITNDTSPSLNDFSMDCYAAYVPSLQVKSGPLSGGTSDHRSFFQHGFPAIFPFEDVGQYSPYIHGYSDTIGTSANDFILAELITKGALATVAELAQPLSLTLNHTALPDTQDETGPYTVSAMAIPQGGNLQCVSMDLHWKLDGGNWNVVPMQPGAIPSNWLGDIPGQTSPARVEYYLVATDNKGRESWLPEAFSAGDSRYAFVVGTYQQIAFFDFEANNDQGWTHTQVATQDDWQRGAPQGLAGDPSSAYSGSNVWGNDLGPSGWNGEYKSNVNNYLVSPAIDCSSASGARLRFARWLTVEEAQYDQAKIRINGNLVWQNPTSGHTVDNAWTIQDLDISQWADGNASVKVRFQLESDGGLEFGGWNIDDFEIYTLAPSGDKDRIRLTGDTSASAGQTVQYNFDGMAGNSHWWMLWSLSSAGTTIQGHDFDLGIPWSIASSGTANNQGVGALSSVLPQQAAGLTLHLEVGARSPSGEISDSNLLTLQVN